MVDRGIGADDAELGEGSTGLPVWVQVLLVVLLVVALLFVAAQLTGVGGDHGPGRHGGKGTPTSVVDDVPHADPGP